MTTNNPPTSTNQMNANYTASLKEYHLQLRERLLEGIWSAPPQSTATAYQPVKSLAATGSTLGNHASRGRRASTTQVEPRSRSRSTDIRPTPGYSSGRPERDLVVSTWSDTSSSSESSQDTPQTYAQASGGGWIVDMEMCSEDEDAFDSRRNSQITPTKANHDVTPAVKVTTSSPSRQSRQSRMTISKGVQNFSLPFGLRSPTVFPTSTNIKSPHPVPEDELTVNQETGKQERIKINRRSKVQALGLGITAMTVSTPPISAAPSPSSKRASKRLSDLVYSSYTNTPAASEDSFQAIAPSPLWSPSTSAKPFTLDNGSGIPFWGQSGPAIPLPRGMLRRTPSSLSAACWDVENDRPVEEDDEHDASGFMDGLLEDYQLAHPATPGSVPASRRNSFMGKRPGLLSTKSHTSSQSLLGDKESTLLPRSKPTPSKIKHKLIPTPLPVTIESPPPPSSPSPSPKLACLRRKSSTSTTADSIAGGQKKISRIVRRLTFHRPHHKDGQGKGRGGDWVPGGDK